MEGTIFCDMCGKEVPRRSFKHKYCSECSQSKQVKQIQEAKHRAKKKREAEEAAEAKRREQEKALNSLTATGKSTARVVAEARAFGMTYGTYTAAIRDGSIERILHAKGFTDPEAVLRGLTIRGENHLALTSMVDIIAADMRGG